VAQLGPLGVALEAEAPQPESVSQQLADPAAAAVAAGTKRRTTDPQILEGGMTQYDTVDGMTLYEAQRAVRQACDHMPLNLPNLTAELVKRGWIWEAQGTEAGLYVAVLGEMQPDQPGHWPTGCRTVLAAAELRHFKIEHVLVQLFALALHGALEA
jgi:hypothetical protein